MGSERLQPLLADLDRAIRGQQQLADELEQLATGGTGQRADVKDWGTWGRAHAARRVAEELAEVAQELRSPPAPGSGEQSAVPYYSTVEVLEALIAEQANSVLREAMVRALGREDGGAPFLQQLAQKDDNYAVRRAAVEALASKEGAYAMLSEIATDKSYDPLARLKAIEVLGEHPGAEAVLTGLLRNEKAETIREAVVRALTHQDMPAEFFIELLRDPSEWVRLAALKALGERSVTVGVFQDLAVHDLSRAVRLAALDMAIARDAPSPFLEKVAAEDKDESMRIRAKQALADRQLRSPGRRRAFWPFSLRKPRPRPK